MVGPTWNGWGMAVVDQRWMTWGFFPQVTEVNLRISAVFFQQHPQRLPCLFAKPQAIKIIKSSIYSPEIQRLEPQNHAISQMFILFQESKLAGSSRSFFRGCKFQASPFPYRGAVHTIYRCRKPRAKRVLGECFGDVAWPSLQKILKILHFPSNEHCPS